MLPELLLYFYVKLNGINTQKASKGIQVVGWRIALFEPELR